jgi:hypothetical protein
MINWLYDVYRFTLQRKIHLLRPFDLLRTGYHARTWNTNKIDLDRCMFLVPTGDEACVVSHRWRELSSIKPSQTVLICIKD